MKAFSRWMNIERGVFFAASAWLALTGVGFQRTDVAPEWGRPRTRESAPEKWPVRLEPPPAVERFLAGDRPNPFADREGTTAFRRRGLGEWLPPATASRPTVRPPSRPTVLPPPPKPPPTPGKPGEQTPAVEGPKAYDLPVRLAGRIQVGRRAGYTIFTAKEDGRNIMVKEGQELPGLGVRVIHATKSVVIVENEKGQRFRLTDLLRANAAAAGGGGE